MDEYTSKLVLELARTFFDYMLEVDSHFQKSYFRFFASKDVCRANGSYQDKSGNVKLFDQLKNKAVFSEMINKGSLLTDVVNKNNYNFCLVLMTIDSNFEYDIKFEFSDPERWRITKVNGGTGLPE